MLKDFKQRTAESIDLYYEYHHMLKLICTDSAFAYSFACCSFLLEENFKFVISMDTRSDALIGIGRTHDNVAWLNFEMMKKLFHIGRIIYEATLFNLVFRTQTFQTFLEEFINMRKAIRSNFLKIELERFKKEFGVSELGRIVEDSFYGKKESENSSCVVC